MSLLCDRAREPKAVERGLRRMHWSQCALAADAAGNSQYFLGAWCELILVKSSQGGQVPMTIRCELISGGAAAGTGTVGARARCTKMCGMRRIRRSQRALAVETEGRSQESFGGRCTDLTMAMRSWRTSTTLE